MESQPHEAPDAARRDDDEAKDRPETSRPAGHALDRLSREPAAPDSDFGAGHGRPSGTGQPFVTSDPGMADQPAEGGEDEVDR